MEIHKNLTKTNYNERSSRSIQYIVIHYTSNKNDTAYNNTQYFKTEYRGSSAHYFIDNDEIWQCVEDKNIAWHCGSSSYKHPKCRNANSIGIEMCTSYNSSNGYYISDKTTKNTVYFTKQLMEKYNIPAENVIRHYDVTGKNCPAPWVTNPSKWNDFKQQIQEDIDMEKLYELEQRIANLENENARQNNVINTMGGEIQEIKNPMIYNYIDNNMPEWAHNAVQWCSDKGVIKGTGEGLGLDDTKLWVCVVIYRTAKFIAGLMKIKI